jgi:hypothetical protein
MARTPTYAKQPATLKPGAWVRLKDRGSVVQVVAYHYDYIEAETADGRTRLAAIRPRDAVLLTADEAAPFITARAARIARDDERAANRGVDVSGRSHFARIARR